MSEDKYYIHRVTPYLTSSDYVTVFNSRKDRSLYRFNPDLNREERMLILDNLKYGADVGNFLACGDLLTVKPKA